MQIQFFFYLILIYFLVIENQVIPKPIKFGLICVHISLLLLIYISFGFLILLYTLFSDILSSYSYT